jgi:phosphosulfolactate synthase (CoM biosynthesis protein A)
MNPTERCMPFIRLNDRQGKPRTRGLTEIRGPYYTPMGRRYLEDVLETAGAYVDALKFAGGSFALMPQAAVKALLDLAHKYEVAVSTGGFIERVLTQGPDAVNDYLRGCRELGFDIVELSCGFITIPLEDYVRTFGPEVNLFVDHSQIIQLECLRSGLWGTNELWGRIHTYKPSPSRP